MLAILREFLGKSLGEQSRKSLARKNLLAWPFYSPRGY